MWCNFPKILQREPYLWLGGIWSASKSGATFSILAVICNGCTFRGVMDSCVIHRLYCHWLLRHFHLVAAALGPQGAVLNKWPQSARLHKFRNCSIESSYSTHTLQPTIGWCFKLEGKYLRGWIDYAPASQRKKMHNSWSLSTATNKQAWTGWISKSKWPEKMDNFARPNRILRIMADIFIEATLSNAFATCWLGRKENVSIRKFQTKLYCSQQKLVDFATQNFDVSIHWSLTSRTRK